MHNPEIKRQRYVTHDECRAAYVVATRAEQLLIQHLKVEKPTIF
ncbi:hypothetical protein [Polaromonas naphthalenivorans]|nr:hypothetical protein [Polaromonas naphthalenivorans]